MFLKSLQISQKNTCVGFFFNKVAGPQNCNFVKNRLHHRFFPENFLNYLRAPIFQRIYERLVLKHQRSFIRTSFFKEHLQLLLLTVSGSSLQLYPLKETLTKMFICEFCKIFKNIFRQNTSGWLHLWILRRFPDHFFYRAPLGNCLFHAQVAGFQPQDTIRIFHKCFSSILYKNKK